MARLKIYLCHSLSTALILTATSAFPQSGGDFGGSFEPASPPAQVISPPGGQHPAPPVADDFGGSFGSGGGGVAPVSTAPDGTAPPPPPPVTGGDDFGGSDFGSGGATPPPPPPPDGTAPPPPPPPDNTAPPRPLPPEHPVQPEVTQPAVTQPDARSEIDAFELRDFGVPATSTLRSGQFHAPTPSSVPGGGVVTTSALAQALGNGQQIVIIDVLGSEYSLPGAYMATALASGGDFNDRIQQQATQWLGQITRGNPAQTIVIYCSDPNCWLSYNAALRAIAAGYTNVYWYRGGLQAWQMAGLQLVPAGF